VDLWSQTFLLPGNYITSIVSITETSPPLIKLGQPLAISAAASNDSASTIEYPLDIDRAGPSFTIPSLATDLAIGLKGYQLDWTRFALGTLLMVMFLFPNITFYACHDSFPLMIELRH